MNDYNNKMDEVNSLITLDSQTSVINRGRAITVGTCYNDEVEIIVRKNDGTVVWCPFNRIQIAEFIHTLSASIGCETIIKTRESFLSNGKQK